METPKWYPPYPLVQAFPLHLRDSALTIRPLIPWYRLPPTHWKGLRIGTEVVAIPDVFYNDPIPADAFISLAEIEQVMVTTLYTLHHDGHVRENAVRQLLGRTEPWVSPFLMIAMGDMVQEVAHPIATWIREGGDTSGLRRAAIENPFAFRRARSRAVSYWHEYYTRLYRSRAEHPGVYASEMIAKSLEPQQLLRW